MQLSMSYIVVYTTSPFCLGYCLSLFGGWIAVPVIDRVTGQKEFEVCCVTVSLSGAVLFSDTDLWHNA